MQLPKIKVKKQKNNKKLLTPKAKLAIITPDEIIHQRGGQKWLNLKNNVKKSLNSNKSKAGHPRFFIKNRIKYRYLEILPFRKYQAIQIII